MFLSDGAANYGPQYYSNTSPYLTNPCKSAVDQAAIYKAAKVLIYTIAYTTTSSDMCEPSPSAKIGNHIVTGNESPHVYESPSISADGRHAGDREPGQLLLEPERDLAHRHLHGDQRRHHGRPQPHQRLTCETHWGHDPDVASSGRRPGRRSPVRRPGRAPG